MKKNLYVTPQCEIFKIEQDIVTLSTNFVDGDDVVKYPSEWEGINGGY